jgi:penicillin-binding protein 1A
MMAMNWAKAQLEGSDLNAKLTNVDSRPSVMLARDGKTKLWTSSDQTRILITDLQRDGKKGEVPSNVIHATLAAEDKRFYEHTGVDYRALVRSIVTDVKERRSAQGGSTLTMQLVKRLYTSTDKSFTRKLHDVALAIQIEKLVPKDDILKDYLNEVYYGQGAYGIKAAALVYFNKTDLRKLTVGEAALLARLVRRPSDENPFKSAKKAISNRNDVLNTELEQHWITQEQYEKALKEKLKLAPRHFGSGEQIWRAPYFVRYVLDTLKRDMPQQFEAIKAGGYTIETTLDPDIEKVTEDSVKEVVAEYKRRRVTTGAFMLMNSDGQVLSMVGGTDFEKHQYNVVVQGHRQPGSSFKPIVYSTALTLGKLSPGDSISSGPYVYTDQYSGDTWEPKNDNGFGGYVSITSAIAGSINTCAARVCEMVGPGEVVNYAHTVFGYTSPMQNVMSIALGSQAVSPIEQAQAYSIFQSHGDRATPFGIVRVVAPDLTVVKAYGPDIHKAMLDPEVAAQMDTYLRAVVTGGTAMRALAIPNARGKTGTTQDNRDAWFCGYTNNLIGIGWVANEQYDKDHNPGPWYYDPMPGIFGGHVPTEIWVDVMRAAQAKYGDGAPQPPQHMERQNIEIDTSSEKPIKVDHSLDNRDTDSTDKSDETDNSDTTDKSDKSDTSDSTDKTAASPTPPPADPDEAPPEDKPKSRRSRDRDQGSPTEMVSVEICADTGLLATKYCPETMTRAFVKGQEPRRYCTKHGP